MGPRVRGDDLEYVACSPGMTKSDTVGRSEINKGAFE